ncbi:MAG TPA: ATPase, T2SS/T4P/T4SS family [Fimbriimonadaceae bacterium]|nr:ATPase, T2SS/T4P/T4SS family [Fimbriimonadaceae bacterium]
MAHKLTRLRDLLLSMKLVTREELAQAEQMQRETPAPIGSILVSLGFLTEERLLSATAAQMGVSPWHLGDQPPQSNAIRRVPGNICRTYQLLPVEVRGDLLVVAMRNPLDLDAIDLVRNVACMRIEPVLVDGDRLMRAIDEIHSGTFREPDFAELIESASDGRPEHPRPGGQAIQKMDADSRPIVNLVNQLLSEAIRAGASDVHIEPRVGRVDVRYRIDGQLKKVSEIPHTLLPMITTRLKIMAEIDIVEFRVPQDGRVSVQIDGRHVDLRVSVLPNHYGQRIALRILDQSRSLKSLEEIGFREGDLALFKSLVGKPYGLFLVTGPTGSGKTTTLYAALAELRHVTNNIMTCEDPIEYDVEGISQSQVNEKVNLTFASQLRATLRQDPDIILVGEIRDGETAQTAMRAAMTGHLVLSTLHCNDAPSAVPRLLDMSIDPFLLSTSLIGVMSQRLLRQLCPHCKEEYEAVGADRDLLQAFEPGASRIWRARGCPICSASGYKGRAPVHEIMPVTPQLARMIAEREPVDSLRAAAGFQSMQREAIDMVLAGETSLAEAQRMVFFETAQSRPRPVLRAA